MGGFPWIRWHQTFDIGYVPNKIIPKVFMAVACDLRDDANGSLFGDFLSDLKECLTCSVHSRYKHDVGYRLSRSGLGVAYGKAIEFQGPIVENVTYSIESKTMNISYTGVTNIELRNRNGFEVSSFSFLFKHSSLIDLDML